MQTYDFFDRAVHFNATKIVRMKNNCNVLLAGRQDPINAIESMMRS